MKNKKQLVNKEIGIVEKNFMFATGSLVPGLSAVLNMYKGIKDDLYQKRVDEALKLLEEKISNTNEELNMLNEKYVALFHRVFEYVKIEPVREKRNKLIDFLANSAKKNFQDDFVTNAVLEIINKLSIDDLVVLKKFNSERYAFSHIDSFNLANEIVKFNVEGFNIVENRYKVILNYLESMGLIYVDNSELFKKIVDKLNQTNYGSNHIFLNSEIDKKHYKLTSLGIAVLKYLDGCMESY